MIGGITLSILEKVKLFELPQKGDERGQLVIAECGKKIPFDTKRIFYIYGSVAGVVRGRHANRKSEFFLVNVSGTSKVCVKDGMGNEVVYSLDKPHIGLYLPPMVWKDMYDFSEDSVLLCISSEHYDASEYIRDYSEFVKEVSK